MRLPDQRRPHVEKWEAWHRGDDKGGIEQKRLPGDQSGMSGFPFSQKQRRFRLRRVVLGLLVIAGGCLIGWWAWSPGKDVRDGRHDRGENGLWLAHGWMGADAWFSRWNKESQKPSYHSPEALAALTERLRAHGITDIFPHLCPTEYDGSLPPVDDARTERFLDAVGPVRVWPWVGGTFPESVRLSDPEWCRKFIADVHSLLTRHPRLAGVQLNVEPMPDGTPEYLTFLEHLRAALPPGRLLSVAAYPPPTRWQRSIEVHWSDPYFRAVAQRCDHLAVMMYDTGIRLPKAYTHLMKSWTTEVLAWSGTTPVLLGVPAYEDADTPWHDPAVENLEHSLSGIHAALDGSPLPAHYRGVAVYCDWEMNAEKWQTLRARFLKPVSTER